jgi:hypothetical protein
MGTALFLTPQVAIAALILYNRSGFGVPADIRLVLACFVLASPVFAIGGLQMLLTTRAAPTPAKRAIAGATGFVLGPLLSILVWMVLVGA